MYYLKLVIIFITIQRYCCIRIPLYKIGPTQQEPKGLENDNIHYYANTSIGTPPQYFNLIFSIGYKYFWVPSINCGNCLETRKYDSSISTTSTEGKSVFSSRHGLGYFASDTVSFGNDVHIEKQDFAQIVSEIRSTSSLFDHDYVDGIVGLSYKRDDQFTSNYIVDNMLEQNLIEKAVFAFNFNRVPNTPHDAQIVFGRSNTDDLYTGEMTYIDVDRDSLSDWKIKIDNVTIGDKSICTYDCYGIFNTGIHISVPTNHINGLHEYIGANYSPATYGYEVNCMDIPRLPSINFAINGKILTLDASDYISNSNRNEENKCQSLITQYQDLHSVYILGHTFMKKYFTEFDLENHRVGLAESVKI